MAFGSDAPCSPAHALELLYAAITRKNPAELDANYEGPHHAAFLPEECISLQEAISCFSLGGAYVVGREHELGRLRPGYLADLCVFRENLLDLSPQDILRAQLQATFVGGALVWERS